jgi:hypothetical protein
MFDSFRCFRSGGRGPYKFSSGTFHFSIINWSGHYYNYNSGCVKKNKKNTYLEVGPEWLFIVLERFVLLLGKGPADGCRRSGGPHPNDSTRGIGTV